VYQNCCSTKCHYCKGPTIKFGKAGNIQRYRCKTCRKTQLHGYKKQAYQASTNSFIVTLLKEGLGIRSIARVLKIAVGTVIKRIKLIAAGVKLPVISTGRVYEVDELRTYIGNKARECWVTYALDKENRNVVTFKVGRRTKSNLKIVTDTLLLSGCKQIFTDGLTLYREIIPPGLHKVKRYGTNRIERSNLTLRIRLKRLNRKTICYSKSIAMLSACVKIYFWL
jgi:insertion element IS1 protein InsB